MSPVQVPISRADSELERVRIFPSSAVGHSPRERRQHYRFPISSAARYILDGAHGNTTTLNISSGGVLLQTSHVLPVGQHIQVLIDWPALLDARTPLRLVIDGTILRSNSAGTAVGITRYSFRLRPRSAPTFSA
jgi:hypothetical protein